MLGSGVRGPRVEAISHDGVGAVVGQEAVERLAEQPDRFQQPGPIGLRGNSDDALDARRQSDVGEGDGGDVDLRGAGAADGVVGSVDS